MRKCISLLAVCLYSFVSLAQNVGIGVSQPQNKLHVGGGFRLDTLAGVGGAGLLKHDVNGVVYGLKFSGNVNEVLRADGTFGPYNPAINGALGWLLAGNSGTNPATNFLGTTDNQPLIFRVNNIRHGYLSENSLFLGSNSGLLNTGEGNIGIGAGALTKNQGAYGLVAVGDSALAENTGYYSTAIGYRTLQKNTFGSANTAIGMEAMAENTTGFENVAIGVSSLRLNKSGYGNVAIGRIALVNNNNGNQNVSIGYQSMINNTSGGNNVAVGANALILNTSGSGNVGIGVSSLANLTTGNYNTAVGVIALSGNKSSENSAFGYAALATNTQGNYNNAFGANALRNNTIGSANVAFGNDALKTLASGTGSSAFGYAVLANDKMGSNSGFGRVALHLNENGYGNTGIGEAALYNNLTGTYNTALGAQAGVSLPNNVSNVIVIGRATGWGTTSSNQVNIGNFSVSWIGGQTGWFHYSDKRIKNDIRQDVPGLDFITRLKPVTYHVDIRKQEEIANRGVEMNEEIKKVAQSDWEGKYDVEKIKMTGFLAQDVEEAAASVNYSFNGVHKPKNGGLYSLDYSAFVVPLVKAMQEQQSLIEKQQKLIEELLKRVEALESK